MFSSRIIKTDDCEEMPVRSFSLQQFNENGRNDGNGSSASHQAKNRKEPAGVSEKEKIISKARQDAERIKQEARSAAEKIEQEAYQQGVIHGKKAGKASVEQEWSAQLEALKKINDELARIKREYYGAHYDSLIDLVFSITRKVLHQELSTNHTIVTAIVRSAIEHAIDREKLKIRINPEDMQECENRKNDFIRELEGIKQLIFEADQSIERGGAVVEYSFGEIDARIEQQLQEVEREIRKVSC